MILIDASVWIDHMRRAIPAIHELAEANIILTHPFVIGEIGLGSIKNRDAVLHEMNRLARAMVATDDEVMRFVSANALFGKGIGYLDAHLLASTKLTEGACLWTFDRRLAEIAIQLNCAADLPGKLQS